MPIARVVERRTAPTNATVGPRGSSAKWFIGLELLARAKRNGWQFDGRTFDEGDGGKPGFLPFLDWAGQAEVGEVPTHFSCRPGRRRTPCSAATVFSRPGLRRRAARSFRFSPQTGSASVWQGKVVKVALEEDPKPHHRRILARNCDTGEKKYFLTNARGGIGVPRVLVASLVRWNVEHVFRGAKGQVGRTPFEGRS